MATETSQYDAHDAANRMTAALSGSTTLAALSYDSLGRRAAIAFDDGSSQSYAYDNAGRAASIVHAFPNTGDDVTLTYAYDPSDREVGRTSSNAAYDWSPAVTSTAYAAANALNQYPSVAAYPYSYWPEGHLLQDDRRKAYYDEQGKLIVAYITPTPGVVDIANYYQKFIDPIGHVMIHVRHPANGVAYPYVYHATDGLRPETVLDWQYSIPPTGPSVFQGNRRYVLGPNPDERLAFIDLDGTTYYPHTDRDGSAIALSLAGSAVQKYRYGPYGESADPITEVGPGATTYAYRYTGQRLDPGTLLYDFKARDYSPALGRFLQPDPAGVSQGPNLYEYVEDDPVNHSDPTGMVRVGQTVCTSDTPATGNQSVQNTPKMDQAMHDNASHVRVSEGATSEKIGFINGDRNGDMHFRNPSDAKTGSTDTQDNARAKGAPGDVAVIHGHIPGVSRGMQDDTNRGRGPGDAQPLTRGLTNGTVLGNRLGVHELVGGKVEFRMINGKMTTSEQRDIQQNLNTEQKFFNPSPP